MADILRLKGWRTFMSDGRSSTTFSTADKKQVAVAVIVGYEPAKIEKDDDWFPVDDTIVDMGRHITASRKKKQKAKKFKG